MQQLTPDAQAAVEAMASRYAVSVNAVTTLLDAAAAGGGTMAQFSHPELGGSGQWMQGGMTMVGDMFNGGLQATVSGLCSELSGLLRSGTTVFTAPAWSSNGGGFGFGGSTWWPSELGQPSSSGGQNGARYAYFSHCGRLAIDDGTGRITVYDTLNHQIGGVQQQQGSGPGSVQFTSQFGTFTADILPVAPESPTGAAPAPPPPAPPPAPLPSFSDAQPAPAPPPAQSDFGPNGPTPGSSTDVFEALERLGRLHQQGVLTDAEFQSKKAELLSRL